MQFCIKTILKYLKNFYNGKTIKYQILKLYRNKEKMIELHLVNNYLNDLSLKSLLGNYISSNSNTL